MSNPNDLYPGINTLMRQLAGHTGTHVIVRYLRGRKPAVLGGVAGHHTTPSGKTVVRYPGAYKWKTVYHCSTEHITVGTRWAGAIYRRLCHPPAGVKVKIGRERLTVSNSRVEVKMHASVLTYRDYRKRMRLRLRDAWFSMHPPKPKAEFVTAIL